MTVRILAAVSRSYREYSTMRSVLKGLHERYPSALLVHGDAEHGDRDAAGMWKSFGGSDEPWPAKWPACAPDCKPGHRRQSQRGTYCPTAGMRRNITMVESAPNLAVVFFDPASKTQGALHCGWHAADAGIPTLIYRQGDPGVEMRNVDDELGVLA